MKFVDQIAEYIAEKELNLDHLVIVLPSVRARKYVEQALVNKAGKPIFAPEITTIDRWIRHCSTFVIQERLALMMELYNVHLTIVEPEEDASFDAFFTWVPQLLSDFDELEKYLVDAKQLFKNLRDIREIERWSPDDEPLTAAQENYLKFWDRLQTYYENLKARLSKENKAYNGMAFRQVAENIDLVFNQNSDAHFLFAGFNALSLSEMSIMKQLTNLGRGHVLIDADDFYLKSDHHEAGHFLRQMQDFLGKSAWPFTKNKMSSEKKKIELIECSQNVAQVHVASTMLSQMAPAEIEKTLLLLADEDLVLPMIKNLPLNIGKANITMGLELRNTSIKLWVDLLFSIQENKERFSSKDALYHKDLARLWKHPFYQAILPGSARKRQLLLEQKVVQNNNLFIGIERLSLENDELKAFYRVISQTWSADWNDALLNFRNLNQLIFEKLNDSRSFEKAILKAFDASLIQFYNGWNAQPVATMGRRVFKQLFQMHFGAATIAYEGNPISGLQIMGLLETRLLDFERIICLGMNEGKMPPGNPMMTLIPMDLRAGVGMPTSREKNGLFAHHFYRLMHDVKDLTITYLNRREDMMSNEASRYLLQMELEWKRENKNLDFTKRQYQLDATAKSKRTSQVEKTPELMAKMDEVLARSCSASALIKLNTCSLDFYYRYLMEYGEEEEVEEEMQNNTFGTILHDALESLFTPFAIVDKEDKVNPKARPLEVQDLVKMKAQADAKILEGFMSTYSGDQKAFQTGKNYLSFEMAKKLIHRYLDFEINRISKSKDAIWIYALEQSVYRSLELEIHGDKKTVNMHGKIDRIDLLQRKEDITNPIEIVKNIQNERIQVIDYKSGKVDGAKLTIKAKGKVREVLTDVLANVNGKYILQLLFYGYLIDSKIGVLPHKLSIISFISYPDEGLNLQVEEGTLKEVFNEFEFALQAMLEKLYDTEIPFSHKVSYFNYCNYCV
ncbi:MAG: PD-(D/E)XK nuclease family protein [Bacteroidetes bacterium]|nr:PD-(D/E)XK nuclease family protein [Bacteroidota bacterium]